MKFKLTTTSFYYRKRDVNKLKKYGFAFEFIGKNEKYFVKTPWKRVNNPSIEIATLEDMTRFQRKVGAIILNGDEIEIYDDYRE